MAGVKRPWSSAFSDRGPEIAPQRFPEPSTPCTLASPDSDTDSLAQVICFGMLCDLQAEFLDGVIVPNSCGETVREGSELYHPLRIGVQRHHMLQSMAGTDIAFLNLRLSEALRTLGDEVRCYPFVTTKEWSLKAGHLKNNSKTQISICLNLYGPSSISAQVGKCLSKAGLFLQHPILVKSSVKYENPHYLNVSPSRHSASTLPTPPLESPIEALTDPDLITSVLDDLDPQIHLHMAQVDQNSIKTPLERHQKEALDFIFQREAEATPQPFSLWRPHTDAFQRQYYQNLVLGHRRAQPPDENFGGIIADEMGLGKTLTMLSAIFMSKERGRKHIYCNVPTRPSGISQRGTTATLVIVPSALILENWIEEAHRHFSTDSLTCSKYYGKDRSKNVERLLDSDFVLTTYATLTSDYRRGTSSLSNVHWLRIVLDEAHSIRHPRTKQFYAVSALSAKYRWCLTGTPIQNHLDDLGALVQFLRIPMFDQPSSFQTSISRPIEHGDSIGADRLRHLLKAVCIRRKKGRLNLPEPLELTHHVSMTQEERAEYSRIGLDHRRAIDDAVSGISKSKEHNGMFQAILRLRIFCNHGTLAWENSNSQTKSSSSADEKLSLLQQADQAICDNCSCDVTSVGEVGDGQSAHFTRCSHLLCQGCVEENRSGNENSNRIFCPICQKATLVKKPSVQGDKSQLLPQIQSGRSSKLEALAKNLISHPTEKSIVFSCWKRTIRLAGSFLAAYGITTAIVDGSMTLAERQTALEKFRKDPNINVLLMTLGTGAVGLNLTVASRIHILEPQWNPLQESQAIGRAIRLGQKKQVIVVRYFTRHSIETYIQCRQSKKLYLAGLGWDADADQSEEAKLKKIADFESVICMQGNTESPSAPKASSIECEMTDVP